MRIYLRLLVAFLLLSAGNVVYAEAQQEKRVTGTVTSEGEPLPGVSVQVKGASSGTITDIDGNYSIEAPTNGTIVFRFVGLRTVEQAVNNRNVINVTMESESKELEEVMVVAYATAKKYSFTGAASTMKAGEIEKLQTSSVSRVLEGTVSGVQASASSGQPGTDAEIRIRGIGSINASSAPLYVVDAISEQVKQEIAAEVAEIVAKGGKRPHLAAILVGHDGGSETYVAAKVKACEVCGFKSSLIRYEADVTEEELLAKVRELNEDADVDGFIVQLPLPKHISEQKVIETIDYRKDVDGFHPINVGRMSIGLPCYVSATPNGILELLKRYHIETQGKKCVVLGRSNIVGKPMAALMMQKSYPGDATVTVCHSRSKDLVTDRKNRRNHADQIAGGARKIQRDI